MKSHEELRLRPELRTKIIKWLKSFHHLDPRYQLLKFFNLVAKEGADQVMDSQMNSDYFSDFDFGEGAEDRDDTNKSLEFIKGLDLFDSSSIMTVWRPTSNDAMRKMMEGSGVGKGLDIKGKSAKKGLLSAFVPFLQIHEEADKALVQPIGSRYRMRVYYSSNEQRQQVIDTLLPLATKEGMKKTKRKSTRRSLPQIQEEKEEEKEEEEKEEQDIFVSAEMELLDDYAEVGWWGIELAQRLFWKGYVANQDITRGTDTETGRPSVPGFQDANLKTLKVACSTFPPPSPFPVVIQLADGKAVSPMSPQHLVMAYEENGNVKPVVSDFDGFLLGWRREALWFGCNLPRDQEKLMLWCTEKVKEILKAPPTTDTWTIRWLDVLREEAKNGNPNVPPTPEYGFGDPKSYGIMEAASKRMNNSGAVRHGCECFNYNFPQEIDDRFLLISDTLSPVPWKYVDVQELQTILKQKIKEGFVFPLNPKWILCDPGWKEVYDELMVSNALYADECRDVWFPRHSGIREELEKTHKLHPQGFIRSDGHVNFVAKKGYSPLRRNLRRGIRLSAKDAKELAELELERYTSRKLKLARQIFEAESIDELEEFYPSDEEIGINTKPVSSVNSMRNFFREQGHFDSDREEKKVPDHENLLDTELSPRSQFVKYVRFKKKVTDEPRRNFSDHF